MADKTRPDVIAPKREGLWSDTQFFAAFSGTIARLNQMLGTQYHPGMAPPDAEALAVDIDKVMSYHHREERYARDWEATRIGFLVMDLEVLFKYRRELFNRYKRRLVTATNNEFSGLRFEIWMAVNLMAHWYRFDTPDPPDFRVQTDLGDVDIECASCAVSRLRDRPLLYKLESAIAKKAEKPYVAANTLLFLDYTNVLFMAAASNVETTHSQARRIAAGEAGKRPFGGIVLFAAIQRPAERRFQYLQDDFLAPHASESVIAVRNRLVAERQPESFHANFTRGI